MKQDSTSLPPNGPGPVGLGRRLMAMVYDAVIVLGLLMIASALALPMTGQRIAGQDIPYTLFLLAVCFAYVGGFWVRGGQTLGMRAWKIKIVSAEADAVSWKAALIRFVTAWLSALPLGLGYLVALFNESRLCWHDRASGTRLVRVERPAKKTP